MFYCLQAKGCWNKWHISVEINTPLPARLHNLKSNLHPDEENRTVEMLSVDNSFLYSKVAIPGDSFS